MNYQYKQRQYQTIELLRLPLAILIIAIHFAGLPIDSCYKDYGVYWMFYASPDLWIRVLISCLSVFSVPVFFFISGFLFFNGINNYSWTLYKKKIKSRVYSLLIPYLIWNVIRFVCEIPSNGFEQLPMIFLAPANGQFWFIRDLLYLSIISPLLYLVIKKTSWLLPIVCYLILSMKIVPWDIHDGFLTIQGLLYFSFGACFSIKHFDIDIIFPKYSMLCLIFFSIYYVVHFIFAFEVFSKLISTGLLILAIPGIFACTRFFNDRLKQFFIKYAKTSFFIYASHKLVGMFLQGIFSILGLRNFFWNDWLYVIRVLLITLLCIGFYFFLERFCPIWMFNYIVGKRK